MNYLTKYVVLVLWLFLVTGCATSPKGQNFIDRSPSQELGRLVVYRPSAFFAAISAPNLYIDGVGYGHLSRDTHIDVVAKPGKYFIEVKEGPGSKWPFKPLSGTVALKSGETKYVRLLLGTDLNGAAIVPGFAFWATTNNAQFTEVSPEIARTEVVGTQSMTEQPVTLGR